VNFFEREPVCLIRSKRSGRASSIERAIAQVGSQSVLNYLGIALADGLDGVLADAADELLVDQQVDPVSRHDSKVPGALQRRSARASHSVRAPSFRRKAITEPQVRDAESDHVRALA
jgi:hypothetical protein